MNEKRKSEGELIKSIFFDDKNRAQLLLEKCKVIEDSRNSVAKRISKSTWLIIPQNKIK